MGTTKSKMYTHGIACNRMYCIFEATPLKFGTQVHNDMANKLYG